ncbi:MAG: hypothetical protein Q4C74_05380 [Rothia sp. (in: high G+C Gram-positive bacteria)]|nr:hypothetical protein [Rothia sp. (in: high G+C Gram-positive bacteria)]
MTGSPSPKNYAQYWVPQEFNRGYGQPSSDIRGRGYFYAVGSLTSGLLALVATLFFFGLLGLATVPALLGIYCAILAIKNAKKPQLTTYSAQAVRLAVGGLACSIVALLLMLAYLVLVSLLAQELALVMDCESERLGYYSCLNRL